MSRTRFGKRLCFRIMTWVFGTKRVTRRGFMASYGLSPIPSPVGRGGKTCGHCPAAFLSCEAHVYMSRLGDSSLTLRMTGRAERRYCGRETPAACLPPPYGGEAGTHVEVIRAQPRHPRRGVKRRTPSRREKGQACLSVASSWPLAGEVPGVVPPVQPVAFLLGIFFFRLHERRSILFCHAEHT